jgi:hypothetical protein
MSISSEEAERDVEASRGELDRTVEALKDKMTPGQLLDETMRTMGDTGGQIFSKFVDQAKENPMPLAVMGLGLAWLMSSNGKGGAGRAATPYARSYAGYGDHSVGRSGCSGGGLRDAVGGMAGKARDAASNITGAAHDAVDTASDAAGALRDRVGDAASGALHGAQDAAARAKAAAGDAAGKAVQYGQRAQQGVADLMAKEPLLIGGAGLLVGLAIGAATPVSEAEKRYVAPIKDKVVDKTKALAQDGLDSVNQAAQATYHAVKEELDSGGGEGATLADRAENVVRAAAQSAGDGASGPH